MKTYIIAGTVGAIDERGRTWLASVTIDGEYMCSHLLLKPLTPCTIGGRVEIRCERDKRGRYTPIAEYE